MKWLRYSGMIFLLCSVVTTTTMASGLTASVDRDRVSLGETLTLRLTMDKTSTQSVLDITPLQKDFHIVNQSRSTQVQVFNGKTTAFTEWDVVLMPKHTGTLMIPALALGDEKTRVVSIEVTAHSNENNTLDAHRDIFLTATLQSKQTYLQSQLVYTVKIFSAVSLEDASLSDPVLEHAIVHRLGEDVSYQTVIQDRTYQVVERRYAIFPQVVGPLIIQSPVLTATRLENQRVPNSVGQLLLLAAGGVPIRKTAPTLRVDVIDKPSTANAGWWLPAKQVTLRETWSANRDQWKAGQPMTRTVTLIAEGLTAAQLPSMSPSHIDGAKLYPDQPVLETKIIGSNVMGFRTEKLAIIPTRAGTLTIPAITVPWWDITAKHWRSANIPPQTMMIGGTIAKKRMLDKKKLINNPTSLPVMTAQHHSRTEAVIWPYLCLGLFLLWVGTVLVWWRWRRKSIVLTQKVAHHPSVVVSRAALSKALEKACCDNNAILARDTLLSWAQQQWPMAKIRHLRQLKTYVLKRRLWDQIERLDRALYGYDQQIWQGAALWQAFSTKDQLKVSEKTIKKPTKEELPALY